MSRNYAEALMQRLAFPKEAQESLLAVRDALIEKGLDPAFETYKTEFLKRGSEDPKDQKTFEAAKESMENLAKESGLSIHPLWMLFFLELAEAAEQRFAEKGWSKQLFEHTFMDLRYKLMECKINKGEWGTFVAGWYPIFIFGKILAHGRLQYEERPYSLDIPYRWGEIELQKGMPVFGLHIPNSKEPLTKEARLQSYRAAFDFYKKEGTLLQGKVLAVVCHSWLMYPPYQEVFPKDSNIWDFAHDFDIVEEQECDFYDAWRVFGPSSEGEKASLPEDTRLQRAFKKRVLEGGPFGDATGILLFDGEKIINRK